MVKKEVSAITNSLLHKTYGLSYNEIREQEWA